MKRCANLIPTDVSADGRCSQSRVKFLRLWQSSSNARQQDTKSAGLAVFGFQNFACSSWHGFCMVLALEMQSRGGRLARFMRYAPRAGPRLRGSGAIPARDFCSSWSRVMWWIDRIGAMCWCFAIADMQCVPVCCFCGAAIRPLHQADLLCTRVNRRGSIVQWSSESRDSAATRARTSLPECGWHGPPACFKPRQFSDRLWAASRMPLFNDRFRPTARLPRPAALRHWPL